MAHFAEIDSDGMVTRVLVTDNSMPREGYDWLVARFGGTWVQTSFNTRGNEHLLGGIPLRKNYAGVGYSYDADRDAFIPPKPFPSWLLNEDTCLWEAPVAPPEGDTPYVWDEDTLSWVAEELPAE